MKRIFICAILIISGILSYTTGTAQTKYYIYSYDDSGNRISRVIDLSKSATIENNSDSSEKEEFIEESLEEHSIKIYPNPTKGLLKIDISGLKGSSASAYIYNLQGKLILNKTVTGTLNEINLYDQPPGMYIMKILIGESSAEWKIIKD